MKDDFVRHTYAITVKELKQLRRDPVSLVLTIMFPILLIGIFIVIVAAFSATSHNIPVVVADLDGSPASKLLIDKLTTSPFIHVTQFVQTEEQALGAVNNAQAVGAVVIPQGFGRDLASGHAFIVIETDNSKITSSSFVVGAVNSGAQSLLLEVTRGEAGATFSAKVASIEVITRPISGRPPTGDTILPGFLGMIAILGAFDDIVNAISRERETRYLPASGSLPRQSILSVQWKNVRYSSVNRSAHRAHANHFCARRCRSARQLTPNLLNHHSDRNLHIIIRLSNIGQDTRVIYPYCS